MGCRKLAGVNIEAWLTCFLDHVHEYDNDYDLDIAGHWIYLFVALALISVAYVLFGMKCYHLHEAYLASLRK